MVHFGDIEVYHARRYHGRNGPTHHLIECQLIWTSRPRDEWVHAFVHTLEEMPWSWYVAAKLRRTIITSEELSVFFVKTFSFQDANPKVYNALHIICDIVLKFIPISYPIDLHENCSIQSMMTCYKLSKEPKDDDELWNVNIPESEGSHGFIAPNILMDSMNS